MKLKFKRVLVSVLVFVFSVIFVLIVNIFLFWVVAKCSGRDSDSFMIEGDLSLASLHLSADDCVCSVSKDDALRIFSYTSEYNDADVIYGAIPYCDGNGYMLGYGVIYSSNDNVDKIMLLNFFDSRPNYLSTLNALLSCCDYDGAPVDLVDDYVLLRDMRMRDRLIFYFDDVSFCKDLSMDEHKYRLRDSFK